MSVYIYSTATESTDFAIYDESHKNKDVDKIKRVITITGEANVAQVKTCVTPFGAVTKISDEDLKELEKNFHFQEMVKNGFLKVSKSNTAIEKVIKDMVPKDGSAPRTPEDREFMKRRVGDDGYTGLSHVEM